MHPIAATLLSLSGFHSVNQGNIGIYWRWGALQRRTTDPGLHWKWPLIDSYAELQVTVQTDSVSDIPCGTSGGVVLTFGKIEVVNRLRKDLARETVANYTISYDKLWIFDKVHHEINRFCSNHTLHEVAITQFDQIDDTLVEALSESCRHHAPGIEIISVRVTKPVLPRSVKEEFEKLEAASAALRVAEQERAVVAAKAETEARKGKIEAQRDADVAAIHMQKEVAQQKAEQEKELIKDAIHLAHEKALADATAYKLKTQAEANKALLTPEYLKLKQFESIGANTKIYFGDKIPTTIATIGAGTEL